MFKFVFPVKIAWLISTVLTVVWFALFSEISLLNFQGCITVYLSRCFVPAGFPLAATCYILSCGSLPVKDFFHFFELLFGSPPRFSVPRRFLILSKAVRLVKRFFGFFQIRSPRSSRWVFIIALDF